MKENKGLCKAEKCHVLCVYRDMVGCDKNAYVPPKKSGDKSGDECLAARIDL